ncbi:unnamed protein product, partial [marine sediment metagenome]
MKRDMTIIKDEDSFVTSDLPLATILSLFYPIEVIDRSNPRRV